MRKVKIYFQNPYGRNVIRLFGHSSELKEKKVIVFWFEWTRRSVWNPGTVKVPLWIWSYQHHSCSSVIAGHSLTWRWYINSLAPGAIHDQIFVKLIKIDQRCRFQKGAVGREGKALGVYGECETVPGTRGPGGTVSLYEEWKCILFATHVGSAPTSQRT